MSIYVVSPGDTVDMIANQNALDVNQIILDNQLVYPYELAVGQALYLQEGRRDATRSIAVSGYAYPFISQWVLEQTLPFLSELPIFSYGFTYSGELIVPYVNEDRLIQAAQKESVLPVLTLTPLDENGRFNNNLITSVVNNPVYKKKLLDQLVETMLRKGYQGVDIDFEYILAEDRDAFTDFVREVTEVMHAYGFHSSVALAPKTGADQQGVLYAGKDYRSLGEAADHVLLMTYEWGYTYGPPMAVAPIPQVRRVVEYALTEIPAYKIDLGIPNYGYDWPLPYERGVTAATTLGNIQAVRLAIQYGVPILFDEQAQSPHFHYQDEQGVEHEVWFEDVRSMQAKFHLISEYDLRGCGYWQIMQWFRANWLLLREQFDIEKFDVENPV